MYRLYWNNGAASLAPHAALEEIGVAYELEYVDLGKGEQHRPQYLALNPHGVVPTLVAGDKVILESHAILLYLADMHPAAELAPAIDDPARPDFLAWMFWLTGTLQNAFLQFRYPHKLVEGEQAQQALSAHAEARMQALFAHVDAHLGAGPGPYLLGKRFSVADLSLAMLARWSRWSAIPGFALANVRRQVDAVAARPAYRRTLEQEGIGAMDDA